MKYHKIGLGIGFALAFGFATPSFAQQAVQWRVEDGGNGHWYAVSIGTSTWPVARAACEAQGGMLACCETAAECNFLRGLHPSGTDFVFVGLFQDLGAPDYAEPSGGWRWLSGAPFDASLWQPGEPNNYFGDERFGELEGPGRPPFLNDVIPGGTVPHFIEWSADCNGDGIVDYGQILDGTFEDSNSNGVPDCCDSGESCLPCPSDIDENGITDAIDLAVILGRWGTNAKDYPRADANGDGTVDANDLAIVLSGWGNCP